MLHARGAASFFRMNSLDAPSQPMAAACPDLPRMTPELLWFLSSGGDEVPEQRVILPDGTIAFAFAAVIYVMTADEWWHFDMMRGAVAW